MTGVPASAPRPSRIGLDLAAARTCDRDARGIGERTDGFESLERGVAPPGCVLLRGDGGRAGQRGVQFGDQHADVGGRVGDRIAGRRSRAASVIRSTAHVQPSTAPGRYSSTLATSVSAPSGGCQVTSPHGVGMPPKPASRSTPIRRGAGCGPSCRWVAHLTTAASPTITDSLVWSTPIARSPNAVRRGPRPQP